MKRPSIIFLLLSLLFLFRSVQAGSCYIALGYVEHRNTLLQVARLLDRMGYDTYAVGEGSRSVVYTGPFPSVESSRDALAAIRKSVAPGAYIVTFASPTRTPCPAPAAERTQEERKAFFVGAALGASFVGGRTKGEPRLDYDPDDEGVSGGLLLGYEFDDDLFSTLDYRHTRLDDIDLDDFFATINYKTPPVGTLSPFVGLLGGYSFMTWRETPFRATRKDRSGESFIGGGQIGAHAPLSEDFRLFALYRYIFMDHRTTVSTGTQAGDIEERSNQTVEMGIHYRF